MNNKITALLERVSTDRQAEEGYSIEAQKETLEAFCVVKSFKNFKHYTDAGFSGSNLNRPEVQHLITDIKGGLVDRVIVYKLDRLSRSQKDTLHLIEDIFIPNNIAFISVTENLDTSTPLGRAMIGILSAFAQLERENIKERMKMGNIQRVKNGFWKGGGCVPCGYDYDKARGILVKNEYAEKVVQVFELYLVGFSTKKIASMLGFKYESQVRDILTRKTYTGLFEYCGQVYESKNEQIITIDTYQKVADMMQQRANTRERGTNLLAGLVFCGKCGARMRYKSNHSWTGLMCNSVAKEKSYMIKDLNCHNKSISIRKVEKAVLEDLFSIAISKYAKPCDDTLKTSVIDTLNKQFDEINKQLKKLYLLHATASDDMLLEAIADTKRKLVAVQKQITDEQIKNTVSDKIEDYTKRLETIKEAWPHMTPKEQRDVLRVFISKIVLTDGKIEIFYRFERQCS